MTHESTRPGTVTTAVALQYATVVLGLITLVAALMFGDDINAAMTKSLEADGLTPAKAEAMSTAGGNDALTVSIGALSAAVALVLAVLLARGVQVARILTWVTSGLALACSLLGMASGAMMSASAEGGRVAEAMEAGYAAAGGWYGPFLTVAMVAQTAACLAVIVLLALPSSHPFFRKAPAEAVLPPEAYR